MAQVDTSVQKKKEIIVLGAGEWYHAIARTHGLNCIDGLGVVGLTTALKIQSQGNYNVAVISEIIPSDPRSIKYTSRWAVGCLS